jgi:hypothetical protein
MRTALGLCMVAVLLAGCGEGNGPKAPSGPQSGVDVVHVGPPPADEDSGVTPPPSTADAGRDAGVPAYSCEHVEALRSSGDSTDNLTSTELPGDFVVTRQAVSWSTDCTTLTIQLSDGNCPGGSGHELDLAFSIMALQDGLVRLGNNDVSADSRNIVATYVRPNRLKPYGTWGSCGAASGQVIFLDAPGTLTKGSILQARYQLSLPACDGSANSLIEVDGAFKIQLRYDFATVCPTTAP